MATATVASTTTEPADEPLKEKSAVSDDSHDETPMKRARRTVDETREKVEEGLETARERFEEAQSKAREVSEQVRERAEHARQVAREQVTARTEQLRDGYERVEGNVRHASDEVSAFVNENPGRAVLIAAAAGFVLGLLLRPRRD